MQAWLERQVTGLDDRVVPILAAFLLGIALISLIHWYYDNHRLERAMAKRARKKRIALALEIALDRAYRDGAITGEDRQEAAEILGREMNCPEILPMKPTVRLLYTPKGIISLPFNIPARLAETKGRVLYRLQKAGVNIGEGLHKVRNFKWKGDKRKKLEKALVVKKST